MDKLAAMRTFRRVVELGGFSAAARSLSLSNAGVSKHVQELENLLGVALLARTTRRISPTEAGRAYYERCARILDDLEEAELALGSLRGHPSGRLRVNAPMSFGILQIAPLIPAFLEDHPSVTLDVVLNDRIVDLVDEGFDVGIRVRRKLEDSSLIARRICSMRPVLVAAPAYLQRYGEPRSIEELRNHRLLDYSFAERQGEWTFSVDDQIVSLPTNPVLSINSSLAKLPPLLAGVGIALEQPFLVSPSLRSGALAQIMKDHIAPEYGLHVVYPSSRHLAPKVRAFVDFMIEKFGKQAPWELKQE